MQNIASTLKKSADAISHWSFARKSKSSHPHFGGHLAFATKCFSVFFCFLWAKHSFYLYISIDPSLYMCKIRGPILFGVGGFFIGRLNGQCELHEWVTDALLEHKTAGNSDQALTVTFVTS